MKKFIFLLIACSLFACRKEQDKTSASGRILQHGTFAPIEGTTVYLQRCEFDGEFLSGSVQCTNIDTLVTNTDGIYDFDDIPSDGIYFIYAKADQYYELIDKPFITERQHNANDIILIPHAWIQLHIKNVNPNGYRTISVSGFGIPGPDSARRFSGMTLDTTVVGHIRGNNEIPLSWLIIENDGTKVKIRDTIYVNAFQTYPYELLF